MFRSERGLRAVENKEVDMNRIYHNIILDELKTKASRLLKASRAHDVIALQRLHQLELTRTNGWKLKDPLCVIAQEYGFETWVDLKTFIENPFEKKMTSRYLNHWFRNYEEAKEFQSSQGGYLLPYKNQFFVCENHFIEDIGLDSRDPSWQEIGFDWVKPKSPRGLFHLYEKLIRLQKK